MASFMTKMAGGIAGCALLTCAGAASAAVVVFEEHFDYANEAALDAAWTHVDGQSNYLVLTTTDADVGHVPYATMNNGVVRRDLDTPISNADWTVTYKTLHTTKQRGGWVGLFDATGKKGYALLWDSGNDANGWGNGTVSVRKFDLDAELDLWNATSAQVGGSVNTGHEIVTKPFAEMTFSWTAATGTLTASVDGVQKLSVEDTSFKDFSRIYLKGNSSVKYDDIVVTAVPEPAAALLGVGLVGLLSRRRRS